MKPAQLVTVANLHSLTKAELLRIYLEQQGIRAFLADVESARVWGGLVESVKLQVEPEHAEIARKLVTMRLEADERKLADGEATETFEQNERA